MWKVELKMIVNCAVGEKGQSRLEVVLYLDGVLIPFLQQVVPEQSPFETSFFLPKRRKSSLNVDKTQEEWRQNAEVLRQNAGGLETKRSKSQDKTQEVLRQNAGKRSDDLVDEEDEEPQTASEPQVEDDEYNLQRGIQMNLESFQAPVGRVAIREPSSGITQRLPVVEGKGKGIVTDEQVAQLLLDLQNLKKQNAETGANTKKSNSEADTEIINVDEK
uniref:Uncharacterized protein n=1 Tax=Tanacetum cinerariifolium TaxID=118510 RepID=A0A6L2MWT3_TANCI|nr:hypothetical protein [Tanacetum cinerariifolium]